MKILLVRPPFVHLKYGPPIGLAYIQDVLKKGGHDVSIWDMSLDLAEKFPEFGAYNRDFMVPSFNPEVNYARERIEEYCEMVLDKGPDLVGFHLAYPTVTFGLEMARRISKHTRCIAGGPQATFNQESLLELGYFDAVVSGYGEEGVLGALSSSGLISKRLDPSKEYHPDYTGVTIDKYNGILPVVTTRGCPNNCTFCTQNHPYYYHSVQSVVNQIQETPGIREVIYNDSNINVNARRTESLFRELASLEIKPRGHVFGMQVVKGFERYIDKMAESGVKVVRLGIESGSVRERKSMNKPSFTNDMVVNLIKELSTNNIETWAQYIFCYPDQTRDDQNQTLDLMKRINDECDASYVKQLWYKFVVHHGTERFFKEKYDVVSQSPQTWTNPLYNPEKIKEVEETYSKLIPKNARIYL